MLGFYPGYMTDKICQRNDQVYISYVYDFSDSTNRGQMGWNQAT